MTVSTVFYYSHAHQCVLTDSARTSFCRYVFEDTKYKVYDNVYTPSYQAWADQYSANVFTFLESTSNETVSKECYIAMKKLLCSSSLEYCESIQNAFLSPCPSVCQAAALVCPLDFAFKIKPLCKNSGNCYDINKNVFTCFDRNSTDPMVCSGNGKCVLNNYCLCKAGYTGTRCQWQTQQK